MSQGNEELERFVGNALAQGASRPSIAEILTLAGWSPGQVNAAMAAYAELAFPVPVPRPRPRPRASAYEAFLYLLLFTALYISAWQLNSLLFDLIDRAFPDAVMPSYDDYLRQGIRWSIASIIVAYPLFLMLARATTRVQIHGQDARATAVRRWLTYLTLFLAGAVFIGDVVVLVYRVLGGELTVRFSLKVLVVAVITGSIFAHYFPDIRRSEGTAVEGDAHRGPFTGRLMAITATVAMACAVAAGFYVVGSPAHERLVKLDRARVDDLDTLKHQIVNHWRQHKLLPARPVALDRLRDPVTSAPYEYEIIGGDRFRLCAVFEAVALPDEQSSARRHRYAAGSEWAHPSGRHCFELSASSGRQVAQ